MIALAILGCMLLSCLFSGMESALRALDRNRLRHLREHGSTGARILLGFMSNSGRMAWTVLIGNTLAKTVALVLMAQWFQHLGGGLAGFAAAMLTALALWFYGDMVPRAIFQRFPNRLGIHFAGVLLVAWIVLWPIVLFFDLVTRLVILAAGGRITPGQILVTREEIRGMGGRHGAKDGFTGEQRNLVASILDSRDARACDVMRPAPEVSVLRGDEGSEAHLRQALQTHFSRFPVQGGPGEAEDRWTGIWSVYDELYATGITRRRPPRVEANAPLEEVMEALRKARSPMAFVRDAERRDVGIVTAEDILRRYLGKVEM